MPVSSKTNGWFVNPTGDRIYALAKELFPHARTITGEPVRKTHEILRGVIPELKTLEFPSGQRCFDWVIPDEWNVSEAYIETLDGKRVVDWADNNLHLVAYSTPVDGVIPRDELLKHIHTRPDVPTAIPYVTSYYKPTWGFCVSSRQLETLTESRYKVVIRSDLRPGSLTCGEIFVPGETEDEILLHTYTCHPSMANNETSGMAVAAFCARYVLDLPRRRFSYRIVFVPETIGAIAYISANLERLRQRVRAGFVLTCVGDDRAYSLMLSRKPGVLPERVARHVLERVLKVPYDEYSFLQRGSDERQYCAPGVDLPVVSIMRSKYGTYPEYHTSHDDLNLISPDGLYGGFLGTKTAIDVLEANETLVSTVLCEPWLSPRGLRPPLVDGVALVAWSALVSHVMAYSDGENDLLAIAEIIGCSIFDLVPIVVTLREHGLLRPADRPPAAEA
jgi:aminopeptidase-like protein